MFNMLIHVQYLHVDSCKLKYADEKFRWYNL